MGIPSLYNWFVAKYPSMFDDANSTRYPNFYDNVYLDNTAIIYEVLHPVDRDSPVTIDQVIRRLYDYMDVIFTMARPRKLVFMALDGVPPRAKLNQQRSRRFRAAKAAADAAVEESKLRDEFQKAGKILPSKNYMGVYFSHLVAPGTSFMASLSDALKHYATYKLNNDPNWKDLKVIVSDANVPGEGEHKIMSFIRQQKNSVGYDANASHCVYGSDTDLIMLGLASHERNFSILRNVVVSPYRKGDKVIGDYNEFGERITKTNTYEFLNLLIFKDYFRREISSPELEFENDFDRRIDDFVLMCFFLGNDFLPNIPSLEINEGAIDLMLLLYKGFAGAGHYLTESNKPNLGSLGSFITALGSYENQIFEKRSIFYKAQLQEVRWEKSFCPPSYLNVSASPFFVNRSMDVSKNQMYQNKNELKKKLKFLLHKKSDTFDPEYNLEEDSIQFGENGWKMRYYEQKFSAKTTDEIEEVTKTAVTKYVEGLCWVMHYYYKGVASWKWYYPYHYAPFASDFKNIGRRSISYEIGFPFKPFTHMLAISSPLAHALYLPHEYRKLITDPNSPIKDFYPTDYEIDINGKRYTSEAILKLPFIDEQRLLQAVTNIEHTLRDDEILLNSTNSEVFLESSLTGVEQDIFFTRVNSSSSMTP